jgi:hypothetical protein
MSWYWVISNSNTRHEPFVADAGDLDGLEDWMLGECRLIQQWSGKAVVRASCRENDGDPDDCLQNLFALPIFSDRLRNALDRAEIEGIQYLPIHVQRPNMIEIEGYCIANILNCVEALDLTYSDYEMYPEDYFLPERRGQMHSLRRVVLKSKPLTGYDIVRLAEYTEKIYVSRRFRDVFFKNGFSGYSFREIRLT